MNELVVAMPVLQSGTIEVDDDEKSQFAMSLDPEVAKILRRRGKIADVRARIILPGPGRLLSDCAAELGAKLAQGGKIFRRHGRAVVVDDEKREISEITEVQFISWLESLDGGRVVCQQFTAQGKKSRLIETTMSKTCAEAILACREFIQSLPEIRRINRVRLPVWNFYDPR